jgi:hypothetical protein
MWRRVAILLELRLTANGFPLSDRYPFCSRTAPEHDPKKWHRFSEQIMLNPTNS